MNGRVFVAKKILLVDDSSTTRVMYRVLISRNTGYEVESARDGDEGLRRAVTSPPDLILMDIMMPGLSGLHVCRALKEDDRTKNIPIILLTSKTGPASVQSGFEFGCDEYLTKPIDEAILLKVLEKYLV